MLTLFSTCKPFKGESDISQRNAIASWTRLSGEIEVVLLGDDEGTAEVAAELGARHVSGIPLSEHGTPFLNGLFEAARTVAKGDRLAYVNADMILLDDFVEAIESVPSDRFLMVGRGWGTEIESALDFETPDWAEELKARARREGEMRDGLDYFVFTDGVYESIPDLIVGRGYWDHWMIYAARMADVRVYDATEVTTVIHQDHGWSHVQGGEDWIWHGPEIEHNKQIAGDYVSTFGNGDASWKLTSEGARRIVSRRRLRRAMEKMAIERPLLKPIARAVIVATHPGRLLRR